MSALPKVLVPREVTRHISQPVTCVLWGRAAGRCEFAGCNKALWKSSVTNEPVNIAQRAHIYSFSHRGPRGHAGIQVRSLNALPNLILACHECHTKIDRKKDGGRYTAPLLQAWKKQHEDRVELVTGIAPSKKSHILLYGANIGDHSSPLSWDATAHALFPRRYPADSQAIEIGTVNGSLNDRTHAFWTAELANLVASFGARVRTRISSGDVRHLSVFGLAPQPLLIALGTMLTDITATDVFQLRREPPGWGFDDTLAAPLPRARAPERTAGEPALVLGLSATVVDARIHDALGVDVTIYRVSVPEPHNDVLVSRKQLAAFRRECRKLLDRIKSQHGQRAMIHVFPVMPVSTSIELGRIRQPKADAPWRVYDQLGAGGFVPILDIRGSKITICRSKPS